MRERERAREWKGSERRCTHNKITHVTIHDTKMLHYTPLSGRMREGKRVEGMREKMHSR